MLQVLKVFTKKRFWKKLCTVLLCLVLCFTLVVNTSIDSFAVAGVDDGLFLLLFAILTASGITFSSVANAHTGTDAFYNNCSQNLQKWLDSKAMEITAFAAGVSSIGITCSKYWSDVIDAIAKTFGDYTGVDVRLPIEGDFTLSVGKKISTQLSYSSTSHNQYVADTFYYDVYGRDFDFSKSQSFISNIHNGSPYNLIIALTIAGSITLVNNTYGIQSNTQGSIDSFIAYNDTHSFLNYNMSFIGSSSCPLYVNGEPCTLVKTSTGYTLQNSAGSNVISGNILVGTDVPVPDSICPDNVFPNEKSLNDWISGLINGDIPSVGALPGNPSIDPAAYPGNDTWHDGIDDVATGNPSIGISVPTDITDETITDYTRDVARDIASADKVLDDTSTEDKPGGDKDDDKDKTGTTPKVPAIGLPEILFKTKFPFCLPWDLYNLFAVLAAEPEAPKFVIPYKNNMLGIDEEYVLDFSKYEDAAKIIRFFTGAGFVLALILISRKLTGSE